ncbi:MAG: lysophospholipid acyltransferase family protein [Thermodesulfobacteriota bacterium]
MHRRYEPQYQLIKFFLKIFSAVPRSAIMKLAVPVGKIWYGLDRRHRAIAYENLRIAFGEEMDRQALNRLIQANFIQLARLFLEIPSLMRLRRENLDRYVVFSGLQHIEKRMSAGKGMLLLTAHLGNWELMALAWALKSGKSCHVIARPLDYAPVNRIMNEIRSATGNRVVDKDDSQALIRQLLQENQAVGILLDQNASWYEGVYVPFFSRLACTNKGLALFALRYGTPILPVFNYPLADGRYRIVIEPPLELIRTGDIGEDVLVNTERFNRVIEKYIRLSPESWFWVHRRWRIIDIPEGPHRKKFEEAKVRYGFSGGEGRG